MQGDILVIWANIHCKTAAGCSKKMFYINIYASLYLKWVKGFRVHKILRHPQAVVWRLFSSANYYLCYPHVTEGKFICSH